MDNQVEKTSWRQSRRPAKRRLIQVYSALLYNAYIKGFIKGEIYTGKSKLLCAPGLNCYSCSATIGACPLGSLQNALASSGNRIGFYVFGIIMLLGLSLGRTICGWLCPMGLIQELLHKIPAPKIRKNRLTYYLSYMKYLFLVVFAILVPLWYGIRHQKAVPGFCKFICPAGTLEGAIGLLSNPANAGYFNMLGIIFTRKLVIMVLIGLVCIFCYRSFCRFICPLGAIYGMFNKLALVGVKIDYDRCSHCGACAMKCKMDVRHVGDHECIHCAQCVDVCRQKAISMKAGSITLLAPEGGSAGETPDVEEKRRKTGRMVWTLALTVLAFALLWYNVIDQSGNKTRDPGVQGTGGQETEAGGFACAPGDELSDFTITCTDGSPFHLEDYRGKVVMINLWATYCGPCVEELPYFNALAGNHADELVVLAVHNSMSKDDIPAYLSDKGWDNLHFALDTKDKAVWDRVGGGAAMPQTIVLDREGKVIYNQVGSVTPQLLEKLYQEGAGGVRTQENI